MKMGTRRTRIERRRRDQLIFVDRRKGKAWMYGQLGGFIILLYILYRLIS